MNAKKVKKLRQAVRREKLSILKNIYKGKPRFFPKFLWKWLFRRAF